MSKSQGLGNFKFIIFLVTLLMSHWQHILVRADFYEYLFLLKQEKVRSLEPSTHMLTFSMLFLRQFWETADFKYQNSGIWFVLLITVSWEPRTSSNTQEVLKKCSCNKYMLNEKSFTHEIHQSLVETASRIYQAFLKVIQWQMIFFFEERMNYQCVQCLSIIGSMVLITNEDTENQWINQVCPDV